MKKHGLCSMFLFLLIDSSADSFAQTKEYFMDNDGFFFFAGIDVPNKNVNLVWDEINNKPVKQYILERSSDGEKFNPVITQDADARPEDVMKMSEQEQASLLTLNTMVYTTETGAGRFIFNEPIPASLIQSNDVLQRALGNRINWDDRLLLESLMAKIPKEKLLVYRIRFLYADGSTGYSGQRSLSGYLSFILQRAWAKISSMELQEKSSLPAWPGTTPPSSGKRNGTASPLAACPPVDPAPACVLATGNSNLINGTCCDSKEEEFLSEQPGGPPDIPCSQSNNGIGYCSPLILDCPPTSSDKCCAGNGCTHYPSCGCKPWECCVYTQPPVWLVTQSNNHAPPAASFMYNNVCLGQTVTFNNTSSPSGNSGPITGYLWDFGDGNSSSATSPVHLYAVTGTFSVTLTITSSTGCVSAITNMITINPKPVANFSATTVCLGNPTQFTDQSIGGGTQWSWSFGDGNTSTLQNPSNTYAAPGNYTVALTSIIASSGCDSSVSKTVIVFPQPAASFSATTVCLNNPTQFTDLSTGGGTTWNWDFGDGSASTQQNPSHTYSASGTFTVTLVSTALPGGCNSSFMQIITVNPQPDANFSATTVCLGFSTQFTDLSAGGGNQWSWNFGDGSSSTQQNPSHTYTASGTFTVSLTSTASPGGCSSTIALQVTVNAPPTANFTVTDICINTNPAYFTDQSAGAASWIWNFGDGTANSGQTNPVHVYGAPGTYSVTLSISSADGCMDSITHIINVNPVPDANFTSTIECFNNPTQFTDQSLGSPNQWSWDFGDGNSGTGQNPTHTYGTPGTYTVTLIATNSLGCSDTLPLTVLVNPIPQANFSCPTVCIGTTSCFTDLSSIASPGVLMTWSWNFDDPASGAANISNLQHPCHFYSAVGTYNVTLTVTSVDGCQTSVNISVSVTQPPAAAFTSGSVCLNTATSFLDQSFGAVSWNWNFGDGGTSSLQNPSHIYLGYGTYIVTLVASAGGVCTDTVTDTVMVNPVPIVLFKSDSVCVGMPTTFTDASFMPSGNIAAWSWDFGDPASGINNTSNLQNPTHIFSSAGKFTVTLTATSASGCTGSKAFTTLVYPGPDADFSFSPASPVNLTDAISFTDLSIGSPVQWWWNFGDNDTSVLQNPEHAYQDMGSYTVTLIAINQNGCPDTMVKPLEIRQFTFYIPNAFTPGTDGKNDFFFGKGVGIVNYEMYIFDRWGNLIFYCSIKDLPQTPPCMWDGKVLAGASNETVQEDVYVWKVKLLDIFGETHKYIGTVTVVK